uniref:LRRNT domain-containing protein n=1 Tax=Branchiostoma floridae TaxID=7739 RepID=C3YJN5_BRAFL|eukprot:XP_002603331.1 hypothetical protein BRAFLDRAFT_71376 [Branchiostoma floridae]
MAGRKALFWLLLVSNHLLLVPEAAKRCPDDCFTRVVFSCRCPNPNGKGSRCSWVGHGGTYVFPVCLDAIPTDFPRETQSIIIEHLSSSTLLEQSFQNLRIERLNHLNIRKSNVSAIQPRAFFGLSYLSHLYLPDNRISRLEADTFLGLVNLYILILEKNTISTISQHAFRGLRLLQHLRLSKNRLTSVPVDALLQPESLWAADLQMNHITTIDRDVVRLTRQQHLALQIGHNKLTCDKNLTWLVCSLWNLTFISQRGALRCAFPPELSGTNLTTMRRYFCQTSTERPQREMGSKTLSDPSLTPTSRMIDSISPHIFNTLPYTYTIPTEGYTEMLHTIPVTEHTTQLDYVIILAENPLINEDVNINYIIAMVSAVVVSLSITTAVLSIFKLCSEKDLLHEQATSTEAETHDNQPYAVAYADSAEIRGSEGSSTTSGRNIPDRDGTPTEDNYTIQPYAVAYGKDPGSDIQPYAVAYGKDPGSDIQPYAVAYGKDPGSDIQPYAVAYGKDPGSDIQPYAVAYGKDPGSDIQPYAVAYGEDPGLDIQPYAIAHNEDPGPQLQSRAAASCIDDQEQDDNDKIQPYAVGYPDSI